MEKLEITLAVHLDAKVEQKKVGNVKKLTAFLLKTAPYNAETEKRTTTKNVTIRTLRKETDALNAKLKKATSARTGLQLVIREMF